MSERGNAQVMGKGCQEDVEDLVVGQKRRLVTTHVNQESRKRVEASDHVTHAFGSPARESLEAAASRGSEGTVVGREAKYVSEDDGVGARAAEAVQGTMVGIEDGSLSGGECLKKARTDERVFTFTKALEVPEIGRKSEDWRKEEVGTSR
jgi:hypothetical protein